jgi:hypothetical protein
LQAGPTVMRLATARAANCDEAKLRSEEESGRSGRSGQTAGRTHLFQTKKIPYASPACRVKTRYVTNASLRKVRKCVNARSTRRDDADVKASARVSKQSRGATNVVTS